MWLVYYDLYIKPYKCVMVCKLLPVYDIVPGVIYSLELLSVLGRLIGPGPECVTLI